MEVEADNLFIFSPKVATSYFLTGQAQIERYRLCVLCSAVLSGLVPMKKIPY